VIDWSSDGSLISCADDYGMVFLVDSQSLDTLDKTSTNFVATEHVTPKITVLKFSSDHNMIALAG
jgi:WD40 repeat protein